MNNEVKEIDKSSKFFASTSENDPEAYKTDECNFCETQYQPGTIRYQCVNCKDFNCCADCYLSKVKYRRHAEHHLFYARSDFDFVIWADGFTLHDDLTLLEAIEFFGFGSWQRIKEYLLRPENEPVEVLIQHYYCVYGENGWLSKTSHIQPLPQKSIRQFENENNTLDLEISKYFAETHTPSQIQLEFTQTPLHLLRYPNAKKLPLQINYNALPKETGEGSGSPYVNGMWPKRAEASYELANKAEYPIMYLSIHDGEETKESMNAKIQVLQAYAHRLVQREKAKRCVLLSSLHRTDRQLDQVSCEADTRGDFGVGGEKFEYFYNNQITEPIVVNEKRVFYEKELDKKQLPEEYWRFETVEKFEAEHNYMMRAFSSRKQFRKYIYNLLQERWFRLTIFYMQIARILGYHTYNAYIENEVISFLKNPELEKEIYQIIFPNGAVQFRQNIDIRIQMEKLQVKARYLDYLKANQIEEKDINKQIDILINAKQKQLSEIWDSICGKYTVSTEQDLRVVIKTLFQQNNNCLTDYLLQMQEKIQQIKSETKEFQCSCSPQKHRFNCLYGQLNLNQIQNDEYLQEMRLNQIALTEVQNTSNENSSLLEQFLISNTSQPIEFKQRQIDLVRFIFRQYDNAAQFMAVTTQAACICHHFLIFLSQALYTLMNSIAFGLSYKEALQNYQQSKGTSLTINHIPLDGAIQQMVMQKYFSETATPAEQQILLNMNAAFVGGDTVGNIEVCFLTTFMQTQDYFAQVAIDPVKTTFTSLDSYLKVFQLQHPILEQLYDNPTPGPKVYVKPVTCFATLAAILRKHALGNYLPFLELLYPIASACGFTSKPNQILFHELGNKIANTNAQDLYTTRYLVNEHLGKLFEQCQLNSLTCTNVSTVTQNLCIFGSSEAVSLPMRLATPKQRLIIDYLPFISKLDKNFLRRREKQDESLMKEQKEQNAVLAEQYQHSVSILSEKQIQLAIQLLVCFINAFEPQFKMLQVKNEQSSNYLDNAQQVFARIDNNLILFNELVSKVTVPKDIIAGDLLKQESVSKNPLDYIFGPQIKPCDPSLENLQLLKVNQSKARLRQPKVIEKDLLEDEYRRKPKRGEAKGRPKDDQAVSNFVSKYLTRGEIGLCVIAGLDIGVYVQCKLCFILYGFQITNHILAAFDFRPGLCEVMAHLVIAQLNQIDHSTVPDIHAKCRDQFLWTSCTMSNVFQRKIKDNKAHIQVSFSFMEKPIYTQNEFDVVQSDIQKRVQSLTSVPASLLLQAAEVKDKQVADAIYERMKQQMWNSALFTEYRKYRQINQLQMDNFSRQGRVYMPMGVRVEKVDKICQTTKSYWAKQRADVIERQELERSKRREERETKKVEDEKRREQERQLEYLRQLEEKRKQKRFPIARPSQVDDQTEYMEQKVEITYDFPSLDIVTCSKGNKDVLNWGLKVIPKVEEPQTVQVEDTQKLVTIRPLQVNTVPQLQLHQQAQQEQQVIKKENVNGEQKDKQNKQDETVKEEQIIKLEVMENMNIVQVQAQTVQSVQQTVQEVQKEEKEEKKEFKVGEYVPRDEFEDE